jgi:hypothetical protein
MILIARHASLFFRGMGGIKERNVTREKRVAWCMEEMTPY